MKRMLAVLMATLLAMPGCAARSQSLMHVGYASRPQSPASASMTTEAWRSFLVKLPAGARVKVTLKAGRRLRATLMQVTDTAMIVSPRTRVPEPVQTIALADLAAVDLETDTPSIAKAVGIGIASGVGAFFTMLIILIASIDD